MKKNKMIGLIGGMGPYASLYFYGLLLKKSNDLYGAKNNDNYPEIVIDSVPVPDFISDTERMDIAKKILISRIEKLNYFGCGILAMVCNTGHLLYPELSEHSQKEFISMIDLVAKEVNVRKIRMVGILATRTTIKSGLYKNALSKFGITAFHPTMEMQKEHELIIRDVLAGKRSKSHTMRLSKLTRKFIKENNLDGIILGCTELPLVFPKDKFRNVVDCLDVLSDNLLKNYYTN